jgi:acyl-CoA synthetase (AMP-forming)/AMP-acid ligase II
LILCIHFSDIFARPYVNLLALTRFPPSLPLPLHFCLSLWLPPSSRPTPSFVYLMRRCAAGQGTLRHLGLEEQLNLQAKQGRGHPLVGMRIVGDDGREKPWDGRSFGNLQVRGPHVVRGYYKVPLLKWDLTVLTLT